MRIHARVPVRSLALLIALLLHPFASFAQTPPPATATAPAAAAPAAAPLPAPRDGSHDFDFLVGSWKATLKRLVNPLSGSTTWVEFEGTQETQHVWGGRGVMDQFIVNDARTNTRIDGLTMRLYNPESGQWSIYWANSRTGTFSPPPTVGRFTNGRGEFYDQEEFKGRTIFVRYVWSDITPTSAHFVQSFSDDGGKTWEPNWISDVTRVKK